MDQTPTPPQQRTGPRPEVMAFVELVGAPPAVGKVVKVEHHTVTVEFPRDRAPTLAIARQTAVAFSSADLATPLAVRSRVVFRRDEDDKLIYEFQFSPIDGETLNAVFRRRTASRVKPAEVVAVMARIPNQDLTPGVSAMLNDISLTGLSLSMGSQGEMQLCSHDRLHLSFKLPNIDQAIELIGLVRYRRMYGTMIRYGIEYDVAATHEYATQEERIAAYMVKRKIESVHNSLGQRAA